MGAALKNFVADLNGKIEAERSAVARFAASLSSGDPLNTLSWKGGDAFASAARMRVFAQAAHIIEAMCRADGDAPTPEVAAAREAVVVSQVKVIAWENILRTVKASPSTSPSANLAQDAEGAAWADVLDALKFLVLTE